MEESTKVSRWYRLKRGSEVLGSQGPSDRTVGVLLQSSENDVPRGGVESGVIGGLVGG